MNQMYELIGKYLAGEANPEEAIAIDKWREETPGNQQVFEQAAAVWEHAFTKKIYQLPDTNSKWEQIGQQLNSRRKIKPLYWISVAAGILVLVAVAYLLRRVTTTRTELTIGHLPDQSVVKLERGSHLSYPADFGVRERQVYLKGSAFFDVKTDVTKPFVVNTNGVKIKVLGTSFNVTDTASMVKVRVLTGAVMVYDDRDSMVIREGYSALYDKHLQQLQHDTVLLRFNDQPLKEVKNVIEQTYHVKVVFQEVAIGNCRLTTEFEGKPSLSYVLDVIAASLGLKYKIAQNQVYFYGNGCN